MSDEPIKKPSSDEMDQALHTLIIGLLSKLWNKLTEKFPQTAYWLSAGVAVLVAGVFALFSYISTNPMPETPVDDVVEQSEETTNVVDSVNSNTNSIADSVDAQ